MMIAGWRKSEVIGLKWEEVDLPRRTAFLGETKTGQSTRPLSQAACEILLEQQTKKWPGFFYCPKIDSNDWICDGLGSLDVFGGLSQGVTPHVLRHSFASLSHDLGYSEPTIASLLRTRGQISDISLYPRR